MTKENQIATLGIKVDAAESIEQLNTLAVAVERANKALDELNGKQFDRISIAVVGQVAKVEVISIAA
jgi:hypothetical protein